MTRQPLPFCVEGCFEDEATETDVRTRLLCTNDFLLPQMSMGKRCHSCPSTYCIHFVVMFLCENCPANLTNGIMGSNSGLKRIGRVWMKQTNDPNLTQRIRDSIATPTDKYRTVVPQVPLKPGEYILFTGSPSPMPSGYGGYDFSVASAK
jgi:hypothetical protein